MLELLLGRAQLWEEVACRDVSLGPQLKPIELLVVGLRERQLVEWNYLREIRQRRACVKCCETRFSRIHCWSLLSQALGETGRCRLVPRPWTGEELHKLEGAVAPPVQARCPHALSCTQHTHWESHAHTFEPGDTCGTVFF